MKRANLTRILEWRVSMFALVCRGICHVGRRALTCKINIYIQLRDSKVNFPFGKMVLFFWVTSGASEYFSKESNTGRWYSLLVYGDDLTKLAILYELADFHVSRLKKRPAWKRVIMMGRWNGNVFSCFSSMVMRSRSASEQVILPLFSYRPCADSRPSHSYHSSTAFLFPFTNGFPPLTRRPSPIQLAGGLPPSTVSLRQLASSHVPSERRKLGLEFQPGLASWLWLANDEGGIRNYEIVQVKQRLQDIFSKNILLT